MGQGLSGGQLDPVEDIRTEAFDGEAVNGGKLWHNHEALSGVGQNVAVEALV